MTTSQRISVKASGLPCRLALASGLLALSALQAQAANIGHSRLVSSPGQPLLITVQVNDIAVGDVDTLTVSVPPASQWTQAGLTPPVPLDTLSASIQRGYTDATRVIQVRSSQPFQQPVVDLLIDVATASGKQRHQVSMLAQSGLDAVSPPASGATTPAQTGPEPVLSSIKVNKGDTLFAIARSNAVSGVSDYQLMVGLYRANPQAFIRKNLNLVKAGATLNVPDRAALTSISDREARRIFQEHARAFDLYRQKLAATPDVALAGTGNAAVGTVQAQSAPVQPADSGQGGDRLRLSDAGSSQTGASAAEGQLQAAASANNGAQGSANTAAQQFASSDDKVALGRAVTDAETRVSQLEQNVQDLNQALQSQSGAATSAAGSTPGAAASAPGSAAGASAASPQNGAGTASGTSTEARSAEASSSDSGAQPSASGGANQASSSTPGATATGAGAADASASSAAGQSPSSSQGGSQAGSSDSGSTAIAGSGSNAATSASASSGASASAGNIGAAASSTGSPGAGAATGSSAASPQSTAASGGGTNGVALGSASADQRAQAVAEPVTQKAEQTVSWLQENMLGVVGALLAFVVLVLAWLLRRGGSRSNDSQEAAEGVITEAMIKDKLENIDLNLDSSPSDNARDTR